MRILNTIKFLLNSPLTQNKLSILGRFIKWQLSNYLLSEKRVFEWIDDARLIVGKGETGLTGNYYVGLMEYEDMGFLLHFLKDDITFVDVGANAGIYTVLASKVKKCTSIAFEPIKETYLRMSDQVNVNAIFEKVTLKNMGVGSKKGVLNFINNLDTVNKVVYSDAGSVSLVDVTTLDAELPLDKKYVMKIDVEGFELEVLKGAKGVLGSGQVEAIVVELNESGLAYGVSDKEIHDYITGFGFTSITYNPKTRKLNRIDSKNQKSGNTIYVRNDKNARERCLAAREHTIVSAFNQRI